MKTRKYLFAAYLLVSILVTGCNRADNRGDRKIAAGQNQNGDWLPQIMSQDEIFLYDKYDQRILTYDLNQHKAIQRNDTLNYLQFEFNDLTSDLYTTGHSITNGYKIIKVGKKGIDTLYEADQMDALFPLAYQEPENAYFLKCTYQDDGAESYEKRIICKFNEKTKTLKEMTETKGMRVTNGVVVGDTLYFTEYDADTDRYQLYMLSTYGNEQPALLSDNLIAGEIYRNNDMLWVSDATNIYSYEDDTICFPKRVLNYFYADHLLQIDVNVNGNLELFVTNVDTRDLEADIEGVIDVRISDGKINVYTDKEIIDLWKE